MDCLPALVLRKIFAYLPVKDLINVGFVCRHWRRVQSDRYVWRNSTFICDDTVTYDDIVFVLKYSSLLEILYINRTEDLEAVLDLVRRKRLNIHTLVIKNMEKLHYKPLQKMAYRFRKLQVLELPDTTEAPWFRTPRMLSKFSNLRRLNLHHYNSIPENTLRFIIDGCPYLEELYIPWVVVVEDDFIYLVEQRKQTLRALYFHACALTEVSLCKFRELQSLRALSLFRCKRMDMNNSKYIRDLNLSALGFTLTKELTSDVMCSLLAEESMRNVKRISVGDCVLLDDSFVSSVTMHCPHVEHLNLFNCKGITERGLEFIIKRCKKLKTLNIVGLPYAVGNTLDLIAKFQKSLTFLRLDDMFDDKRGTKVREFLDTVPTLLPQLKVSLGEATYDDLFPECNRDLYDF